MTGFNAGQKTGIRVVASGGFDSLTFKHGFAVEVSESDRPFEVLHVGDHDPSGGHMFVTLKEDVEAFVSELGGEVTFTRVAVTPAQVAQYDLPTAPQKASDKRVPGRGLGTRRDEPRLAEAIEQRINRSALERVLKREKRARRELAAKLGED